MRSTIIVLTFVAAAVLTIAAAEKDERVKITDGGVYQILNKFDNGSLTVDARSLESVQVYSRVYNETSGQKWRLKKAVFGQSYKLVPTSNEHALLDLDKHTLSIWGRIAAAGNQKYWNLLNMGEGFVQIQNWQKNNLCLTSLGLDKEVSVADCENKTEQQWQFILL